jgi:hypothetical protein
MASVSGLSDKHRAHARQIITKGAALMLANRSSVHYTQGARRWDGINKRLLVSRNQFPSYSDCSSSATWLIWNGIHIPYSVRDTVNAAGWRYGYTGTMLQHGKLVRDHDNIKVGDLAIYGHGFPGVHVAVCLGGGMIFSHGSEAGPFKTSLHYRGDLMQVRRYI